MQEKKFPEGISVFQPNDKAPEWVIANLSIRPEEFKKWLDENKEAVSERGFLRLDIKNSKKGSYYLEVNTYKKQEADVVQETANAIADGEINPDDIPFS
jgi:hypothetical protein